MFDKLNHSELIMEITESLAYYRENDGYIPMTFHFANPNHDDSPFSTAMEKMLELWYKLEHESDANITIGMYDTVMQSFNLNQDFIVVHCDKCIRDFGYALPVSDDVDTLARIAEMVYEGDLYCIALMDK